MSVTIVITVDEIKSGRKILTMCHNLFLYVLSLHIGLRCPSMFDNTVGEEKMRHERKMGLGSKSRVTYPRLEASYWIPTDFN